MPDEVDRDQEFNEQRLEEMIEQSRFKPAATPSLYHFSSAVDQFLKSGGTLCHE